MLLLQRITSEYIEAEDRVRLCAESESGETPVLWLSQRLLLRLLPHLFKWLEPTTPVQTSNPRPDERTADIMQGFAQQAAQASLVPEAPVQSQPQAQNWLVLEVDLKHSEKELLLIFKSSDNRQGVISLNSQQLRQWLGIVYRLWIGAEWPTTLWPEWIREADIDARADKGGKGVH